MRTFIAIELPEEIKNALAGLQEQLKASGADVKWVAPQDIHLTLKFLGETNKKKIDGIMQAMEEAAQETDGFIAGASSLGGFPDINSARVIWAGISKGDKEIRELAERLENGIARVGIPKEKRPFSSHITIGRTKSSLNSEKLAQGLKAQGNTLALQNLEFCVKKITLFKSTLTPKGPVYEPLKVVNLKKS